MEEEPKQPTPSSQPTSPNPQQTAASPQQPTLSAPQPLRLRPMDEAHYYALGALPAWRTKNADFATLCNHYGTANWAFFLAQPRRAYEWVCPRVGAIDALYGPGCAAAWITVQLNAIYMLNHRKPEDMLSQQVVNYAGLMVGVAEGLKLTELMLFLARYHTGHYRNDYANIDVMRLGNVFHHFFLPERAKELAAIEEEAKRKQQELETQREADPNRPRHTMSMEQWKQTTASTLFGLELRFRTTPGSALEQLICRELDIPLPLRQRQLKIRLTRQKMDRIIEWQQQRALEVIDSWPLTPDRQAPKQGEA